MQHKSNIQLIKESIEANIKMTKVLEGFVEEYNINDSIFVYRNGNLYEVCNGYFESELETKNIKQIVENYEEGKGIRIKGDVYQLGGLYDHITECKNINKVLEINHI